MKYSLIGIVTAGLIALLPFIVSRDLFYGSVNMKFFVISGAVALLALWVGVQVVRQKLEVSVSKGQWFLWSLGAVAVVFVLASVLGVYPERSWWSDILRSTGVFYLFHVLALAIMLGALATASDWQLIRRAAIISGGVFGFFSILGSFGLGLIHGPLIGIEFGQEGLTFGNSTFAGAYLMIALILGLVELAYSWGKMRWRVIVLAGIVGIVLSPLLINIGILVGKTPLGEVLANPERILGAARASSATMLALATFLAGYGIIRRLVPVGLRLRALYGWGGVLLVGIASGLALLFVPNSPVQNAYIEASTAARIIVWESGWGAVSQRPVLGWGPENFDTAFERNMDNRLYLKENLAEIWFDRAHNVFIDTFIAVGGVGVLVIVVSMGLFVRAIVHSRTFEHISQWEAAVLLAFPVVHIVQLQTAFDTVGSYVLLGVMIAYGIALERGALSDKKAVPGTVQYIIGGLLIAVALTSMWMVSNEYGRQRALVETFRADSLAQQHELLTQGLARSSDFEGLRITYAGFVEGGLETLAQTGSRERVAALLETSGIYNERFEAHLSQHPGHYRGRINYVYLMLFQTVLGENYIPEAREIITNSYELSPQNPMTHMLHAATELYAGDIEKAEQIIAEGVALNPDIQATRAVQEHVSQQRAQFPNISFLRLGNI